jgi:hypothetical protein
MKITKIALSIILLSTGVNVFADSFPATLEYRKAITGPGYVLIINTTIKQDIPAALTVKSTAMGTEKKYSINLSSRHANKFGHLEGIPLYPGDEITLENNYYDALRASVPR